MRERLWQYWQIFLDSLTTEKRMVVAIPFAWLVFFFLVPILIILKISFSEFIEAIPPIAPMMSWAKEYVLQLNLHLLTYMNMFTDSFYSSAFLTSINIAASATVICLILGFSMAYGITKVRSHLQSIFLLLVILPFWTSFLIRVYAWINLLGSQGMVNSFLIWLGIIDEPLHLLYTPFSVMIGIVYCYLPFMVLPIYTTLIKIDPVYLEAASDLGCRPKRAFWTITVPLAMPGIISGCLLVFIPSIGEFIIPELLGGPDIYMIGKVLWIEFFQSRNWPMACALAVGLLLLFIVPMVVIQRLQAIRTREEGMN